MQPVDAPEQRRVPTGAPCALTAGEWITEVGSLRELPASTFSGTLGNVRAMEAPSKKPASKKAAAKKASSANGSRTGSRSSTNGAKADHLDSLSPSTGQLVGS